MYTSNNRISDIGDHVAVYHIVTQIFFFFFIIDDFNKIHIR